MDKGILIQYCDMKEEIKDLRKRIADLKTKIAKIDIVSDAVKGTRRDGTIGSIMIRGFPFEEDYAKRALLRRRKLKLELMEQELLELTDQVDDYINSIQDSRMRRILRYRYLDDLTWGQVARRMGKKYTADYCRITHDNYLKI